MTETMYNDFSLNSNTKNKKALITGASRGIGLAIARELAAQKCDLYLVCNNSIENLSQNAKIISQEFGISVKTFKADVSNYKEVETIFEEITELDVLINNAGISYVGLLSDMSEADWHKIISVNLDSMFYFSKFSIPLFLKKHSGAIVNISSVWGNVGASMEVAYSASKGGVNSFTKALAKELAPSNITVNAVSCGIINTSMNSIFSPEEIEDIILEIPADRLGQPSEIAAIVSKIIESPSYMTGQIITVDGGWY